jgi:hypothetical protein
MVAGDDCVRACLEMGGGGRRVDVSGDGASGSGDGVGGGGDGGGGIGDGGLDDALRMKEDLREVI